MEQSKKTEPEVEVSALVRVLENLWTAIQRHHPEVPPAVILIGPGDHPVPIWGYWSPARWSVPTHGTRGEVLIAGESLARPAKHTLETLLHEATHALATARKIQDTSRQGRYHNRRYKALAEELGLTVAKHETYGWTLTATTPAVEEKYTAEIAALQAAIDEQHGAHRRTALRALDEGEDGENGSDKGDEDDGNKGRRSMLRQCACTPARTIKVNADTYEQGYIMCGLCARPFLTPGESDDALTRVLWLSERSRAYRRSPIPRIAEGVSPAQESEKFGILSNVRPVWLRDGLRNRQKRTGPVPSRNLQSDTD